MERTLLSAAFDFELHPCNRERAPPGGCVLVRQIKVEETGQECPLHTVTGRMPGYLIDSVGRVGVFRLRSSHFAQDDNVWNAPRWSESSRALRSKSEPTARSQSSYFLLLQFPVRHPAQTRQSASLITRCLHAGNSAACKSHAAHHSHRR